MKKTILLIAVIVLPLLMIAQEEAPKFGINFSGFVRNDVIYNTRQVISARSESGLALAPKPIDLDKEGDDINAAPNFNLVAFTTRLRGKISGPDAFGAKTSGLIEVDFLGSNGGTTFDVRLRHAMFKMEWKKSSLLMGQYWHPMFVTDCFPKTVAFGAGITFNPFARNPQIRYKYKFGDKLSLSAAAISQGQFKSKGDKFSHQNAAMPELNLHLQYKTDLLTLGAQFDYQVLMPRLETDSNYITSTTVSSMSFLGYAKLNLKPLTVKAYCIYGQNNDNMIMIGGYAVTDMVYSPDQVAKDFVNYSVYNTLSYWLDLETTGEKVKFGFFAGMSQNMGAKDSVIISSYTGRWSNVNKIMRFAPRVSYTVSKIKIAFELEYSIAQYAEQKIDANGVAIVGSNPGGIDKYGVVTNYHEANNIKALLAVAYIF